MVSRDLRRDLVSVQSEFGVGYDGIIGRELWSANKRLLADRYGLPIRGYWQTVTVRQLEVIGRPFEKYVLPISSCWQTPDALYKKATITALFKNFTLALVVRSR